MCFFVMNTKSIPINKEAKFQSAVFFSSASACFCVHLLGEKRPAKFQRLSLFEYVRDKITESKRKRRWVGRGRGILGGPARVLVLGGHARRRRRRDGVGWFRPASRVRPRPRRFSFRRKMKHCFFSSRR